MKHLLLTTALVIPSWTLADTSSLQTSSHGLLENQWVKAGINKDSGTFGSGGSTSPAACYLILKVRVHLILVMII